MSGKLVLINNAPNVAQYVLARIACRMEGESVDVLVASRCGLVEFLRQSLAPIQGVRVLALPDTPRVRVSSPSSFRRLRRIVMACADTICQGGNPREVWFFGEFCDGVEAGLVVELARRGARLVDAGHDQYAVTLLKPTAVEWAYCRLMAMISRTPQKIVSLGGKQRQRFLDTSGLSVSRRPASSSPEALRPFLFSVDLDAADARPWVLFFDSASNDKVYEEYEGTVRHWFAGLQLKGFRICVKPHPRLGCCGFVGGIPEIRVIPQEVPGELLDYGPFAVALSPFSVALVHTASLGIPSFCLERCLHRQTVKADAVDADLARLRDDPRLSTGTKLAFPEDDRWLESIAGNRG